MQNDEQTSLLRSSSRQSSLRASIRHIEQISQNAHRLLDDVEEDTDSVNGLLLQDDYSVGSGIEDLFDHDGTDDDGKGDDTVTLGELQFLSNRNSNLIPSSTTSYQDIITDTLDSRKDKLVDRMGEQLLNAPNIESQDRLLRKSLRLDTTTRRNILEISDTTTATTTLSTTIPTQTRQVSVRVHESTKALRTTMLLSTSQRSSRAALLEMMHAEEEEEKGKDRFYYDLKAPTKLQIGRWITITLSLFLLLYTLLSWAQRAVGPPRLPVGEYKIIEAQVGRDFFNYYEFYSGKDSAGSNGYNLYVSREVAEREDIVRVVTEVVDEGSMVEIYEDDSAQEVDWLLEDLEFLDELKRKKEDEKREAQESAKAASIAVAENTTTRKDHLNSTNTTFTKEKSKKNTTTRHLQNRTTKLEAFNPDPLTNATANTTTETFVYLSSSPTEAGPRNSIRLEGRRRFNRGLFIIDLRHMPAGCGTWPAFWLTDEANWPVNGEIDIVEGVNYQDTAKTALHTTKECRMDDVPEGSKTGTWDTAVGIPDKKTGIPDMTFRYAEDCFVYDPHQWINQGCVATDLKLEGRSLGVPLNKNGGGVYALEWDPTNTHIRTWVFSPHGRVPRNLRDAMRTATNADESLRVAPDTTQWGLPYGHFPIGEGTNCPAEHFRNMRLVINLAFCGSVAGTRYFMDCPKQFISHKTCEKWVDSDPDELKEAYWKIRGVYVYEREWQKQWT